jgi:hypothetical protein
VIIEWLSPTFIRHFVTKTPFLVVSNDQKADLTLSYSRLFYYIYRCETREKKVTKALFVLFIYMLISIRKPCKSKLRNPWKIFYETPVTNIWLLIMLTALSLRKPCKTRYETREKYFTKALSLIIYAVLHCVESPVKC